jgi:hypothetical protein
MIFAKKDHVCQPFPDAGLAAQMQRLWPHRGHESGTFRNLCCLLGFHLWVQPDYSSLASRRRIHFCRWCPAVEIDGIPYT